MSKSERTRPAQARRARSLSQSMQREEKATPRSLFELALDKWTKGERFDLGKMAEELGVGRATVFRWAGSRELLYGEVLTAQFEFALNAAKSEAQGEGPEYVADVSRKLMSAMLQHEPLQTFVQQNPDYAMRVLMSKTSTVEQRSAEAVKKALEEAVQAGFIAPVMKLEDLAYLIVRIGEAFLYREAISGEKPDIETAVLAIKILVAARTA